MPRKIINIISPHFSTEISNGDLRIEVAAKTLSSSFKVNVFTLATKGNKNKTRSIKIHEYLTVYFIPVRSYNKSLFILRSLFEFWYSIKLLNISNSHQADLTIVSLQFFFLLPLFGKQCKSENKIVDIPNPLWYYLPSYTVLQKLFRRRILSLFYQALEKFNAITISSEGEKKWLLDHSGIEETIINVISNGINYEKFKQLSELKYSPHSDKFVITYIGNIGSAEKFYSLLNAVNDMKDVRLNLIGDGDELKNLQTYTVTKNFSNVFFHGKLRWTRALPYYQTSDLLFVSLCDHFSTSIPSNLYEYLSTGLPVLYQGNGAAIGLLKKFKNTFIFPDDDVEELEKIIWKIKRLSLSRSKTNCQLIGKYFIREKLCIRFAELSACLLNENKLSEVFVEDILIGLES